MNKNEFIHELEKVAHHEDEYSFLSTDKNLGNNIMMLGLGGSYAYGTNNEDSDIDIRGIAFNTKENLLLGRDFEQVIDGETDTTIYSFDKIIKLLCACNPNTIEILGLRLKDIIQMSDAGVELLLNRKMFLSQVAAYSFGGYANAQLRRLENKSAKLTTQTGNEINILKSIENASVDFKRRYFHFDDDEIKLYVDDSIKDDMDSEIFMDLNLKHYPLRDFGAMLNDMESIIKAYNKQSRRNRNAIEHDKLGKHMCHLIRLYYMCFDILENGDVSTYRENEHALLMDIRNGKYLDEHRQPIPEFYDMVNELEERLDYDKHNTDLPEKVDQKEIDEFVIYMNSKYVMER